MSAIARVGKAACIAIGVVWAYAGLTKLADSVMPAVGAPAAWTDQLPDGVLFAAMALEFGIGTALLFGRRWLPLLGGLILLAGFTLMLFLNPPAPGQPCGCFGSADTFAIGLDPVLRNAAFSCLHVFAFACVSTR